MDGGESMIDNASMGRIASRMKEIEPFHVMALLARARELEAQGRDVIHMEIGEPDFPTPDPIVAAGMAALEQGRHHYTPATGLPALKEAISHYYKQCYRVDIDPEQIIITPGSSGALQLLMAVLVDAGDRVLLADPGYPCNRNFVRLVGGEPAPIPVDGTTGYQLTAQQISDAWCGRSRLVMVASPSNPTGTLVPGRELAAIARFVEQKGGHLLVDEIYHGLVYDGQAETALSIDSELFVINSFSKYFGMTGWRLGWLVAPEAYVPALDKLAQNIFLAASTPAQYAALAAFEPETLALLEQRREIFRQRRDYLLPALSALGFKFHAAPQGAFYLYADCSDLTDDSFAFCRNLLETAGVAVTPGRDFGQNIAHQHIRFAYTTSLEKLEMGVDRIRAYLNLNTGGRLNEEK